jgi:DNA primase small subunit
LLGKKKCAEFLENIRRFNAEMLDAKVTVDVKRILRLPSSLHSAVSMKCVEVKNIEKFDPLRDAVPKFVGERK